VTKSDSEFPDTRASLLLQLQAGIDQDGWQEFVALYRPIIYRLARKRGLQDADAQDLAQQVLVSIAGAIERWHPHDETIRFRHWLRRVTANAISNAMTRRPRDLAAGGTSIQDVLERQDERNRDLSREIELEHRRELFLRAASAVKSEVSADTWQVFQLTVIEECPIEKAALRLSKSVGAAYAARGRVMNRLRRIVNEMEQRES
jgi:RNA polymerase sigma-70 factor (ECF subfamily)